MQLQCFVCRGVDNALKMILADETFQEPVSTTLAEHAHVTLGNDNWNGNEAVDQNRINPIRCTLDGSDFESDYIQAMRE